MPVIFPFSSTFTARGLLDVHTRVFLVALSGDTDALRFVDVPARRYLYPDRLISETGVPTRILTVLLPRFIPLTYPVTVILTLPFFFALITPFFETVAIFLLDIPVFE